MTLYRSTILLLTTFAVSINHVSSEISPNFDCTVSDDFQISNKYNFTKLPDSNVTINDDKTRETIRLRLCSPLEKKCNGQDGYSVCLTKDDGKEVGIGKSPPKYVNSTGTVGFNFTGDICESGQKNYKVLVIMKCDYSVTGESGPELFPRKDPCEIYMIWKTKLACVTPSTTSCSIVDKSNNTFDLSPLTKSSENYVVYLDKQGKSKMIMNVCHSIIHEHGSTCSRPAGACLANSSIVGKADAQFSSYGEVQKDSLVIEDGIIKLKYTNGDMCADADPSLDLPHRTTISFICDPAAIVDTAPEYSNESKPCDYKFTWKTVAACNRTFLGRFRVDNSVCMTLNPETKFQFNLQSLMDRDFAINSTNNTQYRIRVCGPLLDNKCPEGTGVCDTKKTISAGNANSNLTWRHGGPYLNYTDGTSCGNGQTRYTIIAFVCGVEGSVSLPIVLKVEPCYLIIHWYTDLVCERRLTCAQNQTNLIPLIRGSSNYVVKALGKEFYINICRPLVPTPGLACLHGSAVCQAVRNSKGQYTQETSLGFPDQNPVLDGDQNLILNYYQGSQCPESPEKNISSSFKFICDYTGDVGLPEYESYANCQYIFKWRTNIVCGAVVGKRSSPCKIMDPSHPHELDLSSLYKQPTVPRFVTAKGKNYSINICGGKEHCNGSAVCQENIGFGKFSDVTFDYRSKLIKLRYSNGTKCANESYASELSLVCNKTAGIGDPVLRLDSNCSALFEWQTKIACPEGTQEVTSSVPLSTTTEKASTDVSEAYTSVQIWTITVALILVILVIGIWLYLRNPRRCAHLRSRIGAITATKNHSRVQYSRVNTTEEARLLLDTNDPCTDGHIDSDDELLGV